MPIQQQTTLFCVISVLPRQSLGALGSIAGSMEQQGRYQGILGDKALIERLELG